MFSFDDTKLVFRVHGILSSVADEKIYRIEEKESLPKDK